MTAASSTATPGPVSTLAEARKAAGMSQKAFVAALRSAAVEHGIDLPGWESLRIEVSGWENNHHRPSERHARLIATVLGGEADDYSQPLPPPSKSHGISTPFLAGLEQTVAGLIAADHASGNSDLLIHPTVDIHRTLMDVLRDARGDQRDRVRELAAHCAELVGWMYQDSAQLVSARRWTAKAGDLAQAAGAQDLYAYILGRRSAIEADGGDGQQTLLLAETAWRTALTPGTKALAGRQLAQGHAILRDAAACQAAVEHTLEMAEIMGDGEPLTAYVTDWYLHMEGGAALLRLGNRDAAVAYLEHATQSWPSDQQQRDRTLCLCRLAHSYAEAGHLDRAAEVAAYALSMLETAPSMRARKTLLSVRRKLRTATCPEVVAFLELSEGMVHRG